MKLSAIFLLNQKKAGNYDVLGNIIAIELNDRQVIVNDKTY